MATPGTPETGTGASFDDIHHLRIDAQLQVRSGGLDRGTVKRYEDAMRAGQAFPALKALSVDGVLYLVDGFHRHAAANRAGLLESLEVEWLGNGTWNEARWLAFDANRRHGLPLRNKVRREGLRAYVKTRRHLKPKGNLKSYREIGADLGVQHTTLRNWIAKDFPHLFRNMQKENPGGNGAAGPPPTGGPLGTRSVPTSAPELIHQAALMADGHAEDPEANWELLEAIERLAKRLRARPLSPPPF